MAESTGKQNQTGTNTRALGAVEMHKALFAASSIGLPAYKRLTLKGASASVHSAFRGSVNISTRGGLVSFVPHEFGRGPINVNLSSEFFHRMDLRRGDPIRIGRGRILLGRGLTVSFGDSQIYDPSRVFKCPTLKESLIVTNISSVRKTVIGAGILEGVGGLLLEPRRDSARMSVFSRKALPALRSLLRALAVRSPALVRKSSGSLVGLGPGLTPSADDMLSGLMVALMLGSLNGVGPGSVRTLTREISDAARGRTTALSLEFLSQAASGRSNERVTHLVEGIFTGTEREATDLALDILPMGETSGTDIAAGVIIGAELALKMRGNRSAVGH